MTAPQVTLNRHEGSARPGVAGRLANRPVDGLRPERAPAPGAEKRPPIRAGRALPGRLWASRTFGSQPKFDTEKGLAECGGCPRSVPRQEARP